MRVWVNTFYYCDEHKLNKKQISNLAVVVAAKYEQSAQMDCYTLAMFERRYESSIAYTENSRLYEHTHICIYAYVYIYVWFFRSMITSFFFIRSAEGWGAVFVLTLEQKVRSEQDDNSKDKDDDIFIIGDAGITRPVWEMTSV